MSHLRKAFNHDYDWALKEKCDSDNGVCDLLAVPTDRTKIIQEVFGLILLGQWSISGSGKNQLPTVLLVYVVYGSHTYKHGYTVYMYMFEQ